MVESHLPKGVHWAVREEAAGQTHLFSPDGGKMRSWPYDGIVLT